MARRRGNRSGPRNRVVQTRRDGDTGAARVDRLISSQRFNESACLVLCKTSFTVNSLTTGGNVQSWSFPELAATDDFVSMAQQFNTFKVKAIKFQVWPTNPTVQARTVFSTVHVNGSIPASYNSEASVVDAPDSMYLVPGAEPRELYWQARGTAENDFQQVSSYSDYGGFRAYTDQTSTAAYVCTVVVNAAVVFRGRH